MLRVQAVFRLRLVSLFPFLLACEAEPPTAAGVNDGATSATSTTGSPAAASSATPSVVPATPLTTPPPSSMTTPLPTVPNSASTDVPGPVAPATTPSPSGSNVPCPANTDGACEAAAPCPDPDCATSVGGAPPLPSTASGGSTALGGAGAGGSGTAGDSTAAGGAAGGGAGESSVAGSGGAPPTGGCPAAALFCDDFEGAPMLSASWVTRVNGDGTVAVDESIAAHSGTRSVRVNATGYQTFFALSGAPVFPVPGGSLYVRVFIRLREAMTAGHNTYFEAGPSDSTDAQYETRVGVQQQQLMINQPAGDRGFLANQNYYVDNIIGAHLTEETWGCVEVFFDPAASTIRMWLDDAEIPDLARTDWQQDEIAELRFGYEKYAGPNTEIWFDDIVVASEPIGCN